MSGFPNALGALRRQDSLAIRRAVQDQRAKGWLAWLAVALRTITTRRELARMDDRMLKDIGISRGEALTEAERAPWDFGPHAQ